MSSAPFRFKWTDEGTMRPASAFWSRKCDDRFVVGMEYQLEEIQQASSATRKHYFAVLKEAWMSLPDHLAAKFETVEHLRKWALIKAGFHDKRTVPCESVAEARKLAAFMRPLDSYAIVTTEGNVILAYTAQSQDAQHMDRATFQRSKQAVLDIVGDLIGVTGEQMQKVEESA